MKIKAVKFNEKGFMTQPFAMGGEDGMEKFDAKVRYRSCLQNYLIDTGDEVILVDTGLPKEFPEMERRRQGGWEVRARLWRGSQVL